MKKIVLIADSEPRCYSQLRHKLIVNDCDVFHSSSIEDAVKHFDIRTADLLLVDLDVPSDRIGSDLSQVVAGGLTNEMLLIKIMRRENNNHKRPCNDPKPTHIEFAHSTASAVAIAGSFNGWRPEPAQLVGKGKWAKELILPPGTYEYLFVADGRWLPDPFAKGAVPNPFGGVNSLLTVTE